MTTPHGPNAALFEGLPAVTVMQVLPSLVAGGAERGAVDVAIALQRAGGRPIVVSSGGPMVAELDRAGITHIVLNVASKNPFTIHANGRRLARLAERHRVDIIHARSRAPAWSAKRAAALSGAAFMTTVHAAYKFKSEAKRRYNAIMASGERVIAISEFIAGYIRETYGTDQAKVTVIPRGVDVDRLRRGSVSAERTIKLIREWRAPEDLPLMLMPARLTRIKGHEVLIEALALRGKRDLFCVIVGATDADADYRRELEKLIESKGLGDRVRIAGTCSDMAAAYNAAALVVAPSIVPEGFGRVPVEAQAMGKPVIASALGGFKETIEDGVTGLLFPPGDAAALAQAIDSAMALTPDQLEGLAQRAESTVRSRYTKDAMCAATLAVYADLARAHRG
jgi:glycosyltransferase involved in cell wall biosynthesis